jgi:hypothetical protein
MGIKNSVFAISSVFKNLLLFLTMLGQNHLQQIHEEG